MRFKAALLLVCTEFAHPGAWDHDGRPTVPQLMRRQGFITGCIKNICFRKGAPHQSYGAGKLTGKGEE